MLSLKRYSVSVDKKPILKDITLSFEEGKSYVVMGPNGSGKSTLALSLAGSPDFSVSTASEVFLDAENLLLLPPEKRSRAGLFVTFQSPPSISGVTAFQLLRTTLSGRMSATELREKILAFAQELAIPKELLSRSLNDGFSGGERKKMEMLQVAVLEPKVVIFDEIDTGVDVDALKTILHFIRTHKNNPQTFIFITHQQRLADAVSPDAVVILKNGEVVRQGDKTLIQEIERAGYGNL